MKKPLSPAIKRFYGIADMGFSFMANVETYFFAIFITDYTGLPLALGTMVLAITSTFDAIFAPLPGIIIDKSNMKWGRYRSWLLVGPPLVVLLYPFQYSRIGSDTVTAAIICAAFIISHIIWNIYWVSNLSLINILSSTPQERMLLSSHRMMYSSVSRICFGFFALALATWIGNLLGSPATGYTMLALLMALFMWACYTVVFSITKGYEEERTTGQPAKAAEKVAFSDMLKVIGANPPLLVHLLEDLFRAIGQNFVAALGVYYYRNVANNFSLYSVDMIMQAVMAFLGAMCVPYISKMVKDTKRRYVFYSFAMAAFLLLANLFAGQTYIFMGMIAVYSFFTTSLASTNPLMYSSSIIYGEYRHGKNLSGLVMGFSNLPLKIGIVMRAVSISILANAGYVANQAQTPKVVSTIVFVMTIIPAILISVNALLCLFAFPLDDKKVTEIQAVINERKAAQQ